ncbi:uncharacterized protein LODBEIA_P57440 [Lodderomyces beijingensis]|uniref:Structural maintenance of chromosomes protein n=1 Tax=Lodderomyces beijingensis TaxID=1775926 RepID=A0ABP0ZQQ7_9ASCO
MKRKLDASDNSFINNSDYESDKAASEHEDEAPSKSEDAEGEEHEGNEGPTNMLDPGKVEIDAPLAEHVEGAETAEASHGTPMPEPSPSVVNHPSQTTCATPTKPRLVIDRLALTNFKSYAGRQLIGPFHSSFSSVVGPNGSGKSNVIDAMLFVFGFKASKMRQGKISELIHNSGTSRPEYCQVDIHFKMVYGDPILQGAGNVPDSSLVVSRKAFQNNQSAYYINDKKSTYTEVTSLLKKQGIDLEHKRFLILQGEVESIAQMKAKAEKEGEDGLLEYLEDIIGTTKYKQLIEDTTTEIEELNTICQEKSDRLEFVEKDKSLLEEKKAEALKFLDLERKLNHLMGLQFRCNAQRYRSQMQEEEQEASELRGKLQERTEAVAEVTKQITTEKEKQSQTTKELKRLTTEMDRLSKQRKDLNKQNVAFEEKSKNMDAKIRKANKSVASSTASLNKAKQSLSTYANSSAQYKTEIETLTLKLSAQEDKMAEMRAKLTARTSVFTQEIETLQTRLEPWTSKIKENESKAQLVATEINMLESQMNSKRTQLEQSKRRLRDIKAEGKSKEAEYQQKERDLEKITEQWALGEEQTSLLKAGLDKLKSQISKNKNKLHDSLAILQSKENKNSVLASLSKLAKSGRVEGFHGRLGDLGRIDAKYDVAISTAVPGLDSMVVDSVETAQACIEYLRKNRLGYASFICLSKLSKFDLSPINTPGDPSKVKRLFDLVDPLDSKFAPAFFSKMFHTLVAPDLKEAKAVAYGAKRWKVATLDGQVIDTFGTMSGGGNYIQKGAMKLTSSRSEDTNEVEESDLESLRGRISELESKYDDTSKQYNESVAALKQVKKLEPETRRALEKLKLDIAGLASEMKEIAQLRRTLSIEQEEMDATNPFEAQITDKREQLAVLHREKSILQSEMAESETRISELERKIMEAGGVDLKVQSSTVDSIKKQISITNDKTSGDRIAVKKLESDIERHTRNIDEETRVLAELEAAVKELKESQAVVVEQMQSLEVQMEVLNQQKQEKDEQLEVARLEIEEKQAEIADFEQFKVEIKNQLEKVEGHLEKMRRLVAQNEQALDSIPVRDLTPYIYWLPDHEQSTYTTPLLDNESDDDIDIDAVNSEVEEIEKYMSTVRVDVEILREYGTKLAECKERKDDLNKAIGDRDEKRDYCEDMKRKRLDEFMQGFSDISSTLKDMYRMITMGGNAELELVDSLDPFSEGILFSVMPPKKSWKNISNLSGGEKTLSSLALVFALHKYKPTPLYVMDEIDAALDFRNVSIVANYIKERTKNAQFIVISLRNNMFELAQKLVGIYKIDNKTKSVPIMNIELAEM